MENLDDFVPKGPRGALLGVLITLVVSLAFEVGPPGVGCL
jgi:hypothetical protein